MLSFHTAGFNGYSVKYSPFSRSKVAVAASANFGLVGNGRLYILGLTGNGIIAEKTFDTQDSLFDVAWSEAHENQLLAASGDGSIKLFDIAFDQFPVQTYEEHKREVFSVQWNLISKDTFCSSSWDGTVKIWSPERRESLVTIPTHSCTYSVAWSPHAPSILSAVSSDSHLRVFDLRAPPSAANHLMLSLPIHSIPTPGPGVGAAVNAQPSEALTHDWNKYRDQLIVTAGVDRLIRTFDIRAPNQGPVTLMPGHEYAVRKVSWSPHLNDVLISASYDMTCRIWTDSPTRADANLTNGLRREIGRMEKHKEFVTGLDWCLFGDEGWCASCGWDERLFVWNTKEFMA